MGNKNTTQQNGLSITDMMARWTQEGARWLLENPDFFADHEHTCWDALCKDPSLHVDIPDSFLADFAAKAPIWLRGSVAAEYAPDALLLRLAADTNEEVRCAVAGNPSAPVAALVVLAKDHRASVRTTVARNTRTPPASLGQLALDSETRVLQCVLENPSATRAVLRVLQHTVMLHNDGNLLQRVNAHPLWQQPSTGESGPIIRLLDATDAASPAAQKPTKEQKTQSEEQQKEQQEHQQEDVTNAGAEVYIYLK